MTAPYLFHEFFAGAGMARAGLGTQWQCLFANDIDSRKIASYTVNWGAAQLRAGDVADLDAEDIPGHADLAWASFPCQDLSLAGMGAGLNGQRSGAFWPFWHLVGELSKDWREPRMVVLENVCGTLTSHGGQDFAAIGQALSGSGYRFGAVVIDAVHFLPQSRPRLFIIGVHPSLTIPAALLAGGPEPAWHPGALVQAFSQLDEQAQSAWRWWRLPIPAQRTSTLLDLLENEVHGACWHSSRQTGKLLDMMSPVNRDKVEQARQASGTQAGVICKRTRPDGPGGAKIQRAEIRFDGLSGCLRTPSGGSSRQIVMLVQGDSIRSRLLSPRETARLMGLPDTYILPDNSNNAYHLTGDGVAVPVVRFLARHLLEPILEANAELRRKSRACC